jgi:predicted HTH transcriptional regulator
MTREEALAILGQGEFDRFVGTAEGLELEFKSEPYRLDEDSQKFELAKDVSALANAAGGIIVIGLRTDQDDAAAVDVVAEVRALARRLVNEQQYEGTISDRVYPRLQGLHVRFYPSARDAGRGLVAIEVPPQQDTDRYLLI